MFFPLNQVDFFFTFLLPISFHLSVSPCLWLFHIYLCLLKLGLLFDLHTNTGHLFVYFAIFLFICLLFTASVIISFFMYVECMYVCMSVRLSIIHSFNYHLFLHVCMCVCMYVLVYVCMSILFLRTSMSVTLQHSIRNTLNINIHSLRRL